MKPQMTTNCQDMNVEVHTASDKASLSKYKIKACLIISVVIVISMTVMALVYLSVMQPWLKSSHAYTPTVVRVIAKDSDEKQQVNLEYKVDRNRKIAYVTSNDPNGKSVDGIKDLTKGVEAYRMKDENVCFIAKMIEDDSSDDSGGDQDSMNETAQVVMVNESRMFVVLNHTIFPTILKLAVGEQVYKFCGNLRPVWMLPEDEVTSESPETDIPSVKSGHVRQKRWFWYWHGGRSSRNCYYSCYGFWWKKCFRRCYYYY